MFAVALTIEIALGTVVAIVGFKVGLAVGKSVGATVGADVDTEEVPGVATVVDIEVGAVVGASVFALVRVYEYLTALLVSRKLIIRALVVALITAYEAY